MNKVKIGWSEVSITPDKKISLLGQFAERISEYVEKPITVTAMAIECGEDHAVFCSCDLGGTAWNLLEAVRRRLTEEGVSLDPRRVILNATHVHTGPGYGGARRLEAESGGVIPALIAMLKERLAPGQKYLEKQVVTSNPDVATNSENFAFLTERIVKAVKEAWKNRKEASFANAFGRAAVGLCRRTVYEDETAQMWGDTYTPAFKELEGGNDSGMELLFVFDEMRRVSGVVINLACPAQSVQHRLFVSPDFWGEVKVLLRKRFGEHLYVLAQCSAAGDQCPVDLVRFVAPESDINDPNCIRHNPPKRKADPSMFDLSGMRVVGRRIAGEIIAVFEEGLYEEQSEIPFAHKVLDLSLPLRRATEEDRALADASIRKYLAEKQGDVDYNDVARLQIHLGVLKRYEQQKTVETVPTEIHVVRLGSVAFATNPFELFLDYGNKIKALVNCEQVFLVQLANGTEGYLPTEKAEKHGHFSAYIASGLVGHDGGEALVLQTLKEINEMFS
ncbi:MAG: hypothetical protein J6R89_04590 [Clostridia bacterium]|nr:hypothetical protein [Clostridia bacterium]